MIQTTGCYVWWDGDGSVGDRVGHVGANEKPRRFKESPTRTRRSRRSRTTCRRNRLRKFDLFEMLPQGDSSAAPTNPAPPPRDGGGRRGRRLLHSGEISSHGERVGHWEGSGVVGRPRNIPAGEVSRTGGPGF